MPPKDFVPTVIYAITDDNEAIEIGNCKTVEEITELVESWGFINVDVVIKRIEEALGALNHVRRTTGLNYKDFTLLFDAITRIGRGSRGHEDLDLGELLGTMEEEDARG